MVQHCQSLEGTKTHYFVPSAQQVDVKEHHWVNPRYSAAFYSNKISNFAHISNNVRAVTVTEYYSLPIHVARFWSQDISTVAHKINYNIVPYGYMKHVCAAVTSHNCAYAALISASANKQLF